MSRRNSGKLKTWLASWDSGEFDFSEALTKRDEKAETETPSFSHTFARENLRELGSQEIRAFEWFYPLAATVLGLLMTFVLLYSVSRMPAFGRADTPANNSEVIRRYIEDGLTETGAVNIVAGVILDYRAFDTLGESHVLFTASVAVMILLLSFGNAREKEQDLRILEQDLILINTAKILIPVIILFGFYVILNGHLGPGGGFSGGAIIGAGLILYALSFGFGRLEKTINMKTYRIVVLAALLFYSLAKCYSFFCGANGMHTIFTAGIPGRILSAGLILPLNFAVGLVVACTMYGFYSIFARGKI